MSLRVVFEDGAPTGVSTVGKEAPIVVIPKEVTVNINSYREADTFSCELDYKNFPFDPRAIRALGVTIHMTDMKSLYDDGGHFKDYNFQSASGLLAATTVFQGFADEETINLSSSGRSVTFEGRDFTSLLIDRAYLLGPLALNKPIDILIQDLLKSLPETEKITVVNRLNKNGALGGLPTLGSYAPDFWVHTKLGGQINTAADSKYWEVIQDMLARSALVGYIELDKFVIDQPRNLYNAKEAKQFIYGANLKTLSFKRKLGRLKGFNVQMASMNTHDKNVGIVTAKIPEEATQKWCDSMGIQKKAVTIPKKQADGQFKEQHAPYYPFYVDDIADKNLLIEKGQSTFEDVGRQELEGELETREMAVGQESEGLPPFDVTKIRNATPIAIYIKDQDLAQISRGSTLAIKTQYLIDRGYDPKVAATVAKSLETFSRFFYTRSVSFTVHEKEGFSAKIQFINFIVAPSAVKR